MPVFTLVFAGFSGEVPARSGWYCACAAPIGERQNAGIYNGSRKVFERGPGQVWQVLRRCRPLWRGPARWYLQ